VGERGTLIGTVVTLPDVGLGELTAAPVDFVWIDLEHGALAIRDVQPLAIAACAAGAAAFARVASCDDPAIGPALDGGVNGVVVPRVERPSQAQRAVERLRHPPRGSRGVAARRASSYGVVRDDGARGTLGAAAIVEPTCVVQIESRAGVAEAEEIAQVDGVHALVVGAADLAVDLGDEAAPGAESMPDVIARVRRACAAAGVRFGVAGPDDPELLASLAGPGADLLVLGADVRIYAGALSEAVERLRHEAHAHEREEGHVRA
jgi:2-keto-3-deoxy-L-rhamnonate aldolase RhmA